MTQAYWAIRFYLPFEEDKTIQFIGNFENAGKRYLDDIIVFSGMYGAPDFMLWKIHNDMTSYNFSSYSINLKLFLTGDPKSCYFEDNYRILDVGDDLNSDKKIVYAIQEDYAKLDALLIESDISTLEYRETRTVEQLLEEVLVNTGLFPVIFCEHSDPLLQSIKFEYSKFTLDPSWTIRDFIQYIADENSFEWTIKHGILFIGPELYTYKDMKASKEYLNREVDNISKNYWNMKISWAGSPLNVLYYYELIDEEKTTDMRCVWAKHWVGSNGDTTKGCFIPVGRSINKNSYYHSLEGIYEKIDMVKYIKDVKFNQLRIGRITKDAGDNTFADEVTIEKESLLYAKKTPRNMVMNISTPLYTLPKIGRTTPYLDDMAGLFFPRTNNLSKNPNQIIFAINDRIEQAVLGPFVMGNGSPSFIIPSKNPDDLRLQLANGWCLYIKSTGETYVQLDSTPTTIPTQNTAKPHLLMKPDGNVRINKDANCYLEILTDGSIKISKDANCYLEMAVDGSIKVSKDVDTYLEIGVDDSIKAVKDATTSIEITATGIDIKTTQTVNVGRTATAVNLSTATRTIAHGNHIHTIGNLGYPTDNCKDNSAITKVD